MKYSLLRKILSAFLIISVFSSTGVLLPFSGKKDTVHAVNANDISDNSFEYEILYDGTVCITGYNGNDTDVVIPSYINGRKVDKIDSFAFYNSSFESVVISEGIRNIGEYAFYDCEKLKNIDFPESLEIIGDNAFYYCNSLSEIIFSDGIRCVGNNAFRHCESAVTVHIGKNAAEIGDTVFGDCTALKNIDVCNENEYYSACSGILFNKDMTLLICCPSGYEGECIVPDGVEVIGKSSFYNCSQLTAVKLPDTVLEISDQSFSCCDLLTEAVIPVYVESIGEYAFSYCQKLRNVTISEGVSYIAPNAFFCCTGMKKIDVDDNNKVYSSVDSVLFSHDKTMLMYYPGGRTGDYTVPDGVREISDCAFEAAMLLKRVTLPDGLQVIGQSAFNACYAVTSIDIPNSVSEIKPSAFRNCIKLVSIDLPDNLMRIDDHTFSSCTSLKNVSIPDSVTYIGDYSFSNCKNMKMLALSPNIVQIEENAFDYCQNLTIICSSGSYAQSYSEQYGLNYTTDMVDVSVNSTSEKIYAIYSWDEPYITIPEQYPQSFQIEVSGCDSAEYFVEDSDNAVVSVSDTGLAEPVFEILYQYYWSDEQGKNWITTTTSPKEDSEPDNIIKKFKTGTSCVRAYAGGKEFKINITVCDYGEVYANGVIEDYIYRNIDNSMSTEEKLIKIAQFIAARDYGTESQDYIGLIVSGSGDCWASTSTVLTMARKLGLTAWSKSRAGQPGAGSGHINAVVFDGSDYYEVEAGYGGKAPRGFYVKRLTTLFRHLYNSDYDGYEIIQYDGLNIPDNVEIPSEIDGKPVVGIGNNFIMNSSSAHKVVIPETIQYIKDYAFYNSNVTIISKMDSAAQKYAEDRGLEFIDINSVAEVSKIRLNKSEVILQKGQTETLTYVVQPSNALDKSVTWLTSDKTVATVKNGKITAVGAGTCTIYAKSSNGKKASCTVTVKAPAPLNNTSVVSSEVVQVGDKVRVSASANGGAGGYTYAYYYKRSSNNTWKTLGTEFGTTSSVSFTPTAEADFDVKVIVKDSEGTTAEKLFTVKAVKELALTNVSVLQRTNIKLGTAIPMIGKAVGGTGPYTYAFYFKRSTNTNWKLLGDKFGTAATARLKPTASGEYDIRIDVKDSTGTIVKKFFTATVK